MPRIRGGRFSATSRGWAFPPVARAPTPLLTHEPWLVNVHGFMTAISSTNWNPPGTGSIGTSNLYNIVRNSSGAQNAEISFDVLLAAGTWTVELIHTTSTDRGIYSVQFDGVEKGTIDGYSGSAVFNVRSQITSISVASTGVVRLKLKMATKHASSTSYFGSIHHVQFKRTA